MRNKQKHISVSALCVLAALICVVRFSTKSIEANEAEPPIGYATTNDMTSQPADAEAAVEQYQEAISSPSPAQRSESKPTIAPDSEQDFKQEPDPKENETEVEMLACVIYGEAGGNACSDLCRYYVGDVVLNRVADSRFPDTLEGVLLQKGQYGRFYWTGIAWPKRAQYKVEAAAVQRAYETARALLSGVHSELYGAGYVWQAEFKQGTDVIYLDGLYFGK